MASITWFARAALIAVALLPSHLMPAQTVSHTNTNFGLLPNEAQYLVVANPYASLVDRFYFDLTRSIDYTTTSLKEKHVYKLQITGRGGIGPLDRGSAMPDAAYSYVNWQNLDLVHVPGDGFGVTAWDNVWGRRPSIDVYTTTHTYDYFVEGRGVGLNFRFRDNPYGDNVGGYNVSLFEVGRLAVVPEPDSVLLLAPGLLLVGGLVKRRRK